VFYANKDVSFLLQATSDIIFTYSEYYDNLSEEYRPKESVIVMGKENRADFVYSPRTAEELLRPHNLNSEKPYQIVHTVSLSAMSYENFITDMLADRQFLEDYADLCSEGEIWRCIHVKQRGQSGGILVVPDGCYVKYAALVN
jgi:hypothetical protein